MNQTPNIASCVCLLGGLVWGDLPMLSQPKHVVSGVWMLQWMHKNMQESIADTTAVGVSDVPSWAHGGNHNLPTNMADKTELSQVRDGLACSTQG